MQNDVKKLMMDADILLSKISISDKNVFLMAEARKLIKAAYDMIPGEANANQNGKEAAEHG